MAESEEGRILNALIDANLDACDFYREAADKAEADGAEQTLLNLGRIHVGIVEGLGLAAYRNGNVIPMERTTAAKKAGVFGNLKIVAIEPLDSGFVNVVEKAENLCIEALTQAVASDNVSMEIKMHVLDAVEMLHSRHAHIHRLKNMASVSEQAA